MRAVAVHLDAGLGLGLAVGVAADVVAAVDDQHPLAQLGGHPLGDGEAEEPGADDDEVRAGWRSRLATIPLHWLFDRPCPDQQPLPSQPSQSREIRPASTGAHPPGRRPRSAPRGRPAGHSGTGPDTVRAPSACPRAALPSAPGEHDAGRRCRLVTQTPTTCAPRTATPTRAAGSVRCVLTHWRTATTDEESRATRPEHRARGRPARRPQLLRTVRLGPHERRADVAEGLAARGLRVRVVTTQHRKDLPREEVVNGVRVQREPVVASLGKGVISPAFVRAAVAATRRARVVNLHMPMLEAGPIARLSAAPVVLTYQCDVSLPPGALNDLQRRVIDASSRQAMHRAAFVGVTSDDYAEHSRLWPAMRGKSVAIPAPSTCAPVAGPPSATATACTSASSAGSWRRGPRVPGRRVPGPRRPGGAAPHRRRLRAGGRRQRRRAGARQDRGRPPGEAARLRQ